MKEGILEAAKSDQKYMEVKENFQQGNLQQKSEEYKLGKAEILIYKGRIYVSNSQKLKNLILKEMHNVPYVGHPGYQKPL